MLIDKSYFEGDLKIPYDGKDWTEERLNLFIQKNEEELLLDLFGYGLYNAFMAGLQEPVVAEKWQKLLTGAEYIKDGKLKKWDGLIRTIGGAGVTIVRTDPFDIVVGRGEEYDPLPGTDTAVVPPAFAQSGFTLWQRAYGKLRTDEFEVFEEDEDTKVRLLQWEFESEDTYTYIAPNSLIISSDSLLYQSLIANYVYWQWMADVQTQPTPLGNTKPKAENSEYAGATVKMVDAWNEMSRMIKSMSEFLTLNETVYEGWDNEQAAIVCKKFYRTNFFGI